MLHRMVHAHFGWGLALEHGRFSRFIESQICAPGSWRLGQCRAVSARSCRLQSLGVSQPSLPFSRPPVSTGLAWSTGIFVAVHRGIPRLLRLFTKQVWPKPLAPKKAVARGGVCTRPGSPPTEIGSFPLIWSVLPYYPCSH